MNNHQVLTYMENRSRSKLVITLIILILTMFGLALFGLALMLSVDPASSGPAYDMVRWLEEVIPPILLDIQEWVSSIIQRVQQLVQGSIPGIS